jgi:energy-coupling factor transporter ATP-binding protein EcfA2
VSADLARCVARLGEAIDAANALGLDTAEARGAIERTRTRLGFVGDVYVLALVGGTGVGKSTLLNALAGVEVSAASPRRPTTEAPHAWVPAARRAQLRPILEWLAVGAVSEHDGERLGSVAILDLPDIDSIAREHRARVDELLPRIDAVAWVVDPEKYKDQVLHDAYLRRWLPRLGRQIVVLNRSDTLSPPDAERVRDDLVDGLRVSGVSQVPVVLTRASHGAAGVDDLRSWLESEVEAKRVVAGRIGAEVRAAVGELARRGGTEGTEPRPIASEARRAVALADVARGVLAVVDVPGLSAQAAAATRLVARRSGAGPLGIVTSLIYRLSGRARAAADPVAHLRRWRQRGSLAPAVEPIRALLAETLPSLPSALRPAVAALGEPAGLERRLADAVDVALAAQVEGFVVPRSRVWSVIGAAQFVVTALLVFAALWFAALLFLDGPAVGSVHLPLLGPVPTPVVFLAALLLAGYLLAFALRIHAGWLGRRWGRRVAKSVREEIAARVRDTVFVPLDALEASRARLAAALREAATDCPSGH